MGTNKTLIQTLKVSKGLFFITISSLLISGCFGSEDPKPEACSDPFEKTIHADIKGGHLYFDLKDLAFLLDPRLVLDDIDMSVTLRGKHKAEEDIELDINGIKTSRKDGGRNVDRCEYENGGDTSRPYFKLQKFSLNGGEPFDKFLTQVKKNDGVLKVNLHGENTHIIAASISFGGKKYASCPAPSPDPKPTPEPEVATTIDSVSPAEAATSSTDIVFNFSSNIQGSSFWCSLDSAPAVQCSSPKSYTGVSNGSHNFAVYARSPSGKQDNTPATYSWSVDSVPPSVTITNLAALSSLTTDSSIAFEFTASEQGAFQCHLDDSAPITCTSPMNYSALSDGVHTFSVLSIDQLGNAGAPATFQWTVDQTPPIARIISADPSSGFSNINSKVFTFGANESASFECSFDNAPFASCSSPASFEGLSDGSHMFAVRARDAAGNIGLSVSNSWGVDTVLPVVSIASYNPAQGATNAKSVSASFITSEPSSLFYSWDGGTGTEFLGDFSASDVAEGTHTLAVWAVDAAGNRSSDVNLSWSMDYSLPVLSFGAINPNRPAINSTALSVEVNSSKNATLSVSLNHMDIGQHVSPITLTGLTEGSYVLSVTATDSVGNVSAPISYSFVVDLTAPTVSLAAGNTANPTNSDSNVFTIGSSESLQYECNMDEAGFGACGNSLAVSGLADGSHTIQVRATDSAGNTSQVASYTWVIDTHAPVIHIDGIQNGSGVSINLSANESPVVYSCGLNSDPNSACSSTVSYSGLPDGNYVFVAAATDAAGNTSTTSSFSFTVVTVIPKTSITQVIPTNDPTNSTTKTIYFTSDTPGSTFVCSLNGGAEAPCTSPIEYSNLVHGSYNFYVKAVSSTGTVDPNGAQSTWVVDLQAPIITSFATSATLRSITVTWTTNEPSTQQVSWGTNGQLTSSTAETNTFTTSHSIMIPGLISGTTYTIRVNGRDSVGNIYVSPLRTQRTN